MKKLMLIIAYTIFTTFLMVQPLQQAIDLLNNNQRVQALDALNKLENDPTNGIDAALAATLQEISNEHWDEAFTHFTKVYNAAPDPYPYIYALWTTGLFSSPLSKDKELERTKM